MSIATLCHTWYCSIWSIDPEALRWDRVTVPRVRPSSPKPSWPGRSNRLHAPDIECNRAISATNQTRLIFEIRGNPVKLTPGNMWRSFTADCLTGRSREKLPANPMKRTKHYRRFYIDLALVRVCQSFLFDKFYSITRSTISFYTSWHSLVVAVDEFLSHLLRFSGSFSLWVALY